MDNVFYYFWSELWFCLFWALFSTKSSESEKICHYCICRQKYTILDQDHSQTKAFFKASSNSGVFQKHKYNKTQFERSGLFKLAVYCKKTKGIPTESFPAVTDIVLTGGMGCVQKLTKRTVQQIVEFFTKEQRVVCAKRKLCFKDWNISKKQEHICPNLANSKWYSVIPNRI